MVSTHEGEAGVLRSEREEEELLDPLGLHGGVYWWIRRVGAVAPVLGLHRRWPPVGDWLRN